MAVIKKIKIGSTVYDVKDTVSGYTTNVGTVTSVNNVSPVDGNVSLTIPTVNVDDVQINGTSILSSKTANIVTNTAYNASSNKIATMADVPADTGDLTNNAGFVTATYDSTNEQLVLG